VITCDFDPEVFFGNADVTPITLQLQGTNSCHPQKVTIFCKQVILQCNQHQLAVRLSSLQTLDTLDPCHYDELECIDEQLTYNLNVDQACSPPSPIPWSPDLCSGNPVFRFNQSAPFSESPLESKKGSRPPLQAKPGSNTKQSLCL